MDQEADSLRKGIVGDMARLGRQLQLTLSDGHTQPCKPVRLVRPVRLWLKLVRLVRFVRMSDDLKIS